MVGQHFSVSMNPVPYRGAAPAIQDLIGEQLPAAIVPGDALVKYRKAGKVRVLASPKSEGVSTRVHARAEVVCGSVPDVMGLANATEYGFAAYFLSRGLARVWRVSERLEYGIVGVNTGLVSTTYAAFGGIKESGIGREGSAHGIDEYLEMKHIMVADV